jgi:glutathione peroxidase
MKLLSSILLFAILLYVPEIYAQNKSGAKMKNNISDITVKDIDGKNVKLSEYKGKVLLIVNTASKCGHTKQYKDLQALYELYKDKGFEVLAFPSNDFGNQEPGTNEEIKEFCSSNFGVTFRLFDKIKVLGEDKNPLYARLTNNNVTEKSEIGWNFEKFIIAKDGTIVKRIPTKQNPMDEEVKKTIEKELNKPQS